MIDDEPRYVTALGETDVAGGWREHKADGGVLIDVATNETLLSGLSMPVHVISGAHDTLLPHWKQEELAAEIPGSKLTVIERGSHALQLEFPQEFNAAVLDFIAAHERTGVRSGA